MFLGIPMSTTFFVIQLGMDFKDFHNLDISILLNSSQFSYNYWSSGCI